MTSPARLLAPLVGALCVASSVRADAPAAAPEDPPSTLAPPVVAPAPDPLAGCLLVGLVQQGDHVYLPCGQEGVLRARLGADGQLAPEQRLPAPGRVRALFVRGDTLWVELERLEARPLWELAAEPGAPIGSPPPPAAIAPAARPPAPASAEPADTEVLRQDGLQVTVATASSVHTGDRVELFTVSSDGEETSHAVGEVTRIARGRAHVELGLGEIVPAGARARLTQRGTTASIVAPPRVPRLITLEGGLAPYLPVGNLGFGALAQLAVSYAFERPLYLRAELSPVGLILSKESDAGVLAGHVLAGYDHSYFAVGLGLGVLMGQREQLYGFERSGAVPVLSVKQATRLGARDGLHLRVDTSFALADDKWQFAAAEVQAQVPLGARTWLTLTGGGGDASRYARGALGLRRLVYGHGGSGSLFVAPSVGVVGVSRLVASIYDTGPSVGVQLEWRR